MKKRTSKLLLKVTSFLRWLLFIFFKTLFLPYVLLVQNVRFKRNGFKPPKGPCFFISNHASNWDGLYVELMFFGRTIHFLINEIIFRNKVLNFLANKVLGMVKRGEGKNDMTSVKNILDLKKKGKNIGLYPEGDISMWGRTLEIDDSIAKLCKKLSMPIVLLRVDGAYMRACRWGRLPRRTRIVYNIVDVLTVDKIKTLSVQELHKKILDAIGYDDMKRAKEINQKVFFPLGRAENLEHGLYWCPKCHALHSLYSSNNTLYCASCNLSVTLDKYYRFSSSCENIPRDPVEWADKQAEFIPTIISSTPSDKPIFSINHVRFYVTQRRHFFSKSYTEGTLFLYKDRIEHYTEDGQLTSVLLSDAEKICLQGKAILEIHTDMIKLRFTRPDRIWSAYSWEQVANYLKQS